MCRLMRNSPHRRLQDNYDLTIGTLRNDRLVEVIEVLADEIFVELLAHAQLSVLLKDSPLMNLC